MSAGTFNQPQQGYGQPGYTAPQARGKSGMAIASLVLGILGVLTFVVWGSFLFGTLAIIFGALARNETRREGKEGYGMAVAGLTLGIIGIALTLVFLAIGLAAS